MAYKGKFRPSVPKKYKGDYTNIIYRSLWELKFMKYCDSNKNILEWGSEEFFIPYLSPIDNRAHRYFPDFYIKVRESNGQIKKYVIEIKPNDFKEVSKILDKNSVHFEELGIIIEKDMIINEKTKVTIDELKSYNTNWLTNYISS